MDVLFEYRGSRRQLTISSGDSVTQCVTNELRSVGRARARVVTADSNLSNSSREEDIYLLQKWSPQWECYVDVGDINDIVDGDRLTVIAKPKPPSKLLVLCCCCCSSSVDGAASDVKGVPKRKQKKVKKNEEIQALDYKFAVESEATSDWESQSVAASDTQDKGTSESTEQYVRAPSGRASWKLIPSTENLLEIDETDDGEQASVNGDGVEGEGGDGVEGDGGDGVQGGGGDGVKEGGDSVVVNSDDGVQGGGSDGVEEGGDSVVMNSDNGVQGGGGDGVEGDGEPSSKGIISGEGGNKDTTTATSHQPSEDLPAGHSSSAGDAIEQD